MLLYTRSKIVKQDGYHTKVNVTKRFMMNWIEKPQYQCACTKTMQSYNTSTSDDENSALYMYNNYFRIFIFNYDK